MNPEKPINPLTILEKAHHPRQLNENDDSQLRIQKQTLFDEIRENEVSLSAQKTKQIEKINKKTLNNLKAQNPDKHYKTRMCDYGQQCKKQFTCKFAHNESQLRRSYRHRKEPCVRFQKGLCSLGRNCPNYHGNMDLKKNYKYQEKVCEDFFQGKCSKGILCIHRHQLPEKAQEEKVQSLDLQNLSNQQSIEPNKVGNEEKITSESVKQQQNMTNQTEPQPLQSISKNKLRTTIEQEMIASKVDQDLKEKSLNVVDEGFNIEFNF